MTSPRSRSARRRDAERRLVDDVDVWVATAGADGEPNLVPLSHHWDGETLLLATNAQSPTGASFERDGRVRIAVGLTRDVTVIDGVATSLPLDAMPTERADAFAEHAGFDPRQAAGFRWYLVTPQRVQSWREVDELPGRTLMRDGRWLEE